LVTDSAGTLDITFDRSFFDSIFEGVEDDFFILIDGDFADFTETKTTQSRTLSIQVPSGTEEIEIIGSVFGDSSSISTEDSQQTKQQQTKQQQTKQQQTKQQQTKQQQTKQQQTKQQQTKQQQMQKHHKLNVALVLLFKMAFVY